MDTAATFAEKLKRARKNAGLTQEQLEEKLLVSRQAITKWESEKGLPDIENLKLLSQVLGISIDDFLSGEESAFYGIRREKIDLNRYEYRPKLSGAWRKKRDRRIWSSWNNFRMRKSTGLPASQRYPVRKKPWTISSAF